MTKSDLVRARVEAGSRIPRRGALPLLSVVVASSGTPRELTACLAALAPQLGDVGAELVLVRADQPAKLAAVVADVVDAVTVRLVPAPPGSTRGQLRSLGLGAAGGDVVAITEDDRTVPPDWLATLCWRFRAQAERRAARRSQNGARTGQGEPAAP